LQALGGTSLRPGHTATCYPEPARPATLCLTRFAVKLVTRYVLKEHAGPLAFALAALTSLLLLQYIARQFERLVGKGLPWTVIGEFFMLSLPFTVAMTMPMAVLVATLYAFGRMAAEHEITAFKASGVRVRTLMAPVLIASALIAVAMVIFNDQVLPRANHRLAMLTGDIASAKPTLALRPQVINQVTPTFFMRVGRLDESSNRMKDVVIYDVTNPSERQTIYADSGYLVASPSKNDLDVVLYDGVTQRFARGNTQRLERVFFRSQAVRVRDIYRNFSRTGGVQSKGEREMSVCEMESEYFDSAIKYEKARRQYQLASRDTAIFNQIDPAVRGTRPPPRRRVYRGLGTAYCTGVQLVERAIGIPSAAPPGTLPPTKPQPAVATPSITPSPSPDSATVIVGAPGVVPPAPAAAVAAGDSTGAVAAPPVAGQPGVVPPPTVPAAKPMPDINPYALPAPSVRPMQPATTPVPARVDTVIRKPDDGWQAAVGRVRTLILPAALEAQPPAGQQPTPAQPPTPQPTPVVAQPAPAAAVQPPTPAPAAASTDTTTTVVGTTPNAPVIPPAPNAAALPPSMGIPEPNQTSAFNSPSITMMMDELRFSAERMDKYDVEIQKKFSLAAACFVFVLFGPPIALRFPRGGVGSTIGVSLVVFGLYYCCLMAGEALADRNFLPAWVAMWGANVIFTVVALVLLWQIERTADASRGGGLTDRLADWRARRALERGRSAQITMAPSATEPA
jgi:lipopolysaccharide export system permease protein